MGEYYYVSGRDDRYSQFSSFLETMGLSGAFICGTLGNDSMLQYITGRCSNVIIGTYYLTFPTRGEPTLFLGDLSREATRNRYISKSNDFWVKQTRLNTWEDIAAQFIADDLCRKKIGIQASSISLEAYNKLVSCLSDIEFVDISQAFKQYMMVNDKISMEFANKSLNIVEQTYQEFRSYVKHGFSIIEARALLDYIMYRKVTGSTYNVLLQYIRKPFYNVPENAEAFCEGDIYSFEISATYGNSSTQRIYDVCIGEENPEFSSLFFANKSAIEKISTILHPGLSTSDIVKTCDDVICSLGFIPPSEFAPSPIGHLMGMSSGAGTIYAKEPYTLKSDMIIVIHPSAKSRETGHYLFGPSMLYRITDSGAIAYHDPQTEIDILS